MNGCLKRIGQGIGISPGRSGCSGRHSAGWGCAANGGTYNHSHKRPVTHGDAGSNANTHTRLVRRRHAA